MKIYFSSLITVV